MNGSDRIRVSLSLLDKTLKKGCGSDKEECIMIVKLAIERGIVIVIRVDFSLVSYANVKKSKLLQNTNIKNRY